MVITSTEFGRLRVVSNIGEERNSAQNNVHETEGLKFLGLPSVRVCFACSLILEVSRPVIKMTTYLKKIMLTTRDIRNSNPRVMMVAINPTAKNGQKQKLMHRDKKTEA